MTTADYLHATATLMRERAQAVLASVSDSNEWWRRDGLLEALGAHVDGASSIAADAEHFASCTPEFMLALATWIDACALDAEVSPDRVKANALAVCRAYNPEGEGS